MAMELLFLSLYNWTAIDLEGCMSISAEACMFKTKPSALASTDYTLFHLALAPILPGILVTELGGSPLENRNTDQQNTSLAMRSTGGRW